MMRVRVIPSHEPDSYRVQSYEVRPKRWGAGWRETVVSEVTVVGYEEACEVADKLQSDTEGKQ